jgi:L-seryl-tRNA(Ser) seleniumtransferase
MAARIEAKLASIAKHRIRRVLNGTGVLLHTNLGRSPLDQGVWDAARELNEGYSNLEFDLETGQRGRRGGLIGELASLLAGAESAMAVNNAAAAVLLTLSTLAAGKEVIVSRGEQIQIGGGFRIPEILALSGARLVEVGTTNITTASDYVDALTPDTALVLRVHTSNFVLRGFSSAPTTAELAKALPEGVPLIVDQGSGCTVAGIPGETELSRYLKDGAALVVCSSDKLLGGPQAGLILGREALVRRMAAHPLARAFRPGKAVLALLEETLVRRLNGAACRSAPPPLQELRDFGERVLKVLATESVRANTRLVPSEAARGGGSTPDETFPSLALEYAPAFQDSPGFKVSPSGQVSSGGPGVPGARSFPGVRALEKHLRLGNPAVVAQIHKGALRLDLAGLVREDPELLALCIDYAFAAASKEA